MFCINIRKHDKEAYHALLDLVLDKCDTAQLVVRDDVAKAPSLRAFNKEIEPYLIQSERQSEWAGTRLGDGNTALVMHYHVNIEIIKIFKEQTNSFFKWVQPSLPEDLSFFKEGTVMLANTAHEKELNLITKNEKEITNYLENLNIEFEVYAIS